MTSKVQTKMKHCGGDIYLGPPNDVGWLPLHIRCEKPYGHDGPCEAHGESDKEQNYRIAWSRTAMLNGSK